MKLGFFCFLFGFCCCFFLNKFLCWEFLPAIFCYADKYKQTHKCYRDPFGFGTTWQGYVARSISRCCGTVKAFPVSPQAIPESPRPGKHSTCGSGWVIVPDFYSRSPPKFALVLWVRHGWVIQPTHRVCRTLTLGLGRSQKNPLFPVGFEPVTSRLLILCANHYATGSRCL